MSAPPSRIESLCQIARVLADALEQRFGIAAPRIAVCGLNPHAGEGGHLGDEELRVIGPAVERMQREGIRASGPLPADTMFVPQVLAGFDAVLAMYHDQGLPVIKHAGFDHAVNVTLGLPIIRTSVDHGTALTLPAPAARMPAAWCRRGARSRLARRRWRHGRGSLTPRRKRFGQHFLHDPA